MRRLALALASFALVSCGNGGGSDSGTSTGTGGGTQPASSAPAILLSPSNSATFSATSGATSPVAQTITITNGGTGTLSALAAGTVTYGAGQTGGWLTAGVAASTAPTTLTLTPSTGSLLAGSYSASVPLSSSASGVTNSPQTVTVALTVAAGAPSKLVFTTQPPASGTGALTPALTVAIEDAAGNLVTSATNSVTIAIGTNPSGATLSGTATASAVAGVATFSTLALNKSGTGYTIVASATGLTSATSAPFTVAATVATQLAFSVQPSGIASGGTITPSVAVAVKDASGNIVATATNSVTLALGTNPGGAVLGGTTTVAAVAGVATFSNLSLNAVGSGYTLVATATGLTSATSGVFAVSAAATSVTLPLGGSSSFLTSPNFTASLNVTAGSSYLIAVVNTDAEYTQQESFQLTGTYGLTAASAQARPAPGRAPIAPLRVNAPASKVGAAQRPTYAISGKRPPSLARMNAAMQNHTALLSENRQIFAKFGSPRAAWSAARTQLGRTEPVSAAVSQTVGTINKVYVKHSLSGSCTAVDSIGARTVAVGQHVIVLADTNTKTWTAANRPDSTFYASFVSEYDQVTWPHIVNNIGNPLAYDSSLSKIGKITVTITPVLNNFNQLQGGGSIVAFVNGCDFFPAAASGPNADLSNQTEMFYSWVPDTTSANNAGFDPVSWGQLLRATAAHETKHIVSYTDRIMNNSANFEEIWLEEGLAQASSEIWERNFNQATWLGNANFVQTVACEIPLGANAPCDISGTKPIALTGSHLPFLFNYLYTESATGSEGLGLDTPANYGAGWTISRWVIDQYANGAEGSFIKSLINEPQLIGVANIAQHTAQSAATLLVYWNLAMATFQDRAYTPADARINFPSFDLINIFEIGQTGLTCGGVRCGLFTDSGNPEFPITPLPLSTATPFTKTVSSVSGTAAQYFILTATAAGVEHLQLLTTAGQPLSVSSGFRVAILRVQ